MNNEKRRSDEVVTRPVYDDRLKPVEIFRTRYNLVQTCKKLARTGNKYILLIINCSLLIFNCCNKEDAWDILKTRGDHVVVERPVSAFRAITVKNGINVVLSQGDSYAATIEGWKNLMPKIRLSVVKNGELVIEDVNKCNFVRSRDNMSTVHLTFAGELDSIHFAGNGNFITKDTIVTSGLTVISFGSGSLDLKVKAQGVYFGTNNRNIASITISGQGVSAGITNWGYSPINLSGFKALYASVAQNGYGNVYVNASESVDVLFISGQGDVYYSGNPSSVTFAHKDKAKGKLYQIDN